MNGDIYKYTLFTLMEEKLNLNYDLKYSSIYPGFVIQFPDTFTLTLKRFNPNSPCSKMEFKKGQSFPVLDIPYHLKLMKEITSLVQEVKKEMDNASLLLKILQIKRFETKQLRWGYEREGKLVLISFFDKNDREVKIC